MHILDYILPQEAKLSALQTKQLDLSLISSLVDATLKIIHPNLNFQYDISPRSNKAYGKQSHSLDYAILLSANWFLQLQYAREELKAATGFEVTHLDICSRHETVGKPFIRLIKDNISSRLRSSSKDVLSAYSIFDPKKVQSLSTHELPLHGDSSIQTLIGQFGRDLPDKSLEGRTEFEKAAIVSSDLSTKWKTYHQKKTNLSSASQIAICIGITKKNTYFYYQESYSWTSMFTNNPVSIAYTLS